MRTIRASETGTYIYCQRAWWYRKNGVIPENTADIASGLKLHTRHGRMVLTVGCMRILAYVLLLIALVVVVAYLTLQNI